MRKTIKKVMIVVPVLITNCQVSEYLKNGPETAQIITMETAVRKAKELPVNFVAQFANFSKIDLSDFFISLILEAI